MMRRCYVILVLETIVINVSERNVKEGSTSHLLLRKGGMLRGQDIILN